MNIEGLCDIAEGNEVPVDVFHMATDDIELLQREEFILMSKRQALIVARCILKFYNEQE